MNEYNIPIAWESYKVYKAYEKNLEEAVENALREFLAEPDENYLSDSFSIDEIIYDDYPEEDFDINKIIQKL